MATLREKFPKCWIVINAACRESSGAGIPETEPLPRFKHMSLKMLEDAEDDLINCPHTIQEIENFAYASSEGYNRGETISEFATRMSGEVSSTKNSAVVVPETYPESALRLIDVWLAGK